MLTLLALLIALFGTGPMHVNFSGGPVAADQTGGGPAITGQVDDQTGGGPA